MFYISIYDYPEIKGIFYSRITTDNLIKVLGLVNNDYDLLNVDSLHLMKKFDVESQAVIMCGISGSGKTYYARQLEKEGFSRLSTDVLIWEKFGDKLSSLSKEEQKRLFSECREQVSKQLVFHLKSGRKVVVDATHCKRSVRDDIRNICSQFGVTPVFVYLNADKEVLWDRLSKRKGAGPDDLIVTREELSDYWLGFERPQDDESDFIILKQN